MDTVELFSLVSPRQFQVMNRWIISIVVFAACGVVDNLPTPIPPNSTSNVLHIRRPIYLLRPNGELIYFSGGLPINLNVPIALPMTVDELSHLGLIKRPTTTSETTTSETTTSETTTSETTTSGTTTSETTSSETTTSGTTTSETTTSETTSSETTSSETTTSETTTSGTTTSGTTTSGTTTSGITTSETTTSETTTSETTTSETTTSETTTSETTTSETTTSETTTSISVPTLVEFRNQLPISVEVNQPAIPVPNPAETVPSIPTTLDPSRGDYSFQYSVNDKATGDVKSQQEKRINGVVTGYYMLMENDGTFRKVDYTADAQNGFRASVNKLPSNAYQLNY